MPDPAEACSLPDQSAVPDVSWRALARATYDQAVEIMEKPPLIGTMRELFDHRLGTYGQAYEVMHLVEAYTEHERLREAIAEAVDEIQNMRVEDAIQRLLNALETPRPSDEIDHAEETR